MKKLLLMMLLAWPLLISCQPKEKKPATPFNAETFVPSYKLIAPENWGIERFGIPIEFAPSIPYTGVEDLRFSPSWGISGSEDYWTYCYLWRLDGKEIFNAETLKENLEAYYTGLVGRNIVKRQIPHEKVFPVKASFEIAKTYAGDFSTYKGSIYMLDYMAQQPITLNCLVHVKQCSGKDNTFVFYEVSPQQDVHVIWNTLNKIWAEFECNVNPERGVR